MGGRVGGYVWGSNNSTIRVVVGCNVAPRWWGALTAREGGEARLARGETGPSASCWHSLCSLCTAAAGCVGLGTYPTISHCTHTTISATRPPSPHSSFHNFRHNLSVQGTVGKKL